MEEKPIRLVAGLGNPGPEYAATRHNIGFMVVDLLVHEAGLAWEKSSKWDAATAKLGDALLVKPASYMNRSGHPLFAIAQFFKIAPPEIFVNGENLGPVTITLPDLADPAYRGQTASLLRGMRFQYTGWLRAQKVVPAASLKVGNNDLIIVNGSAGSTSAVRATQIELKYLWEKSDYLLRTGQ